MKNNKHLDGSELYNYLIDECNCSEEIAIQIMKNNKKNISFLIEGKE